MLNELEQLRRSLKANGIQTTAWHPSISTTIPSASPEHAGRVLPSLDAMLAFYCGPETRVPNRMRIALLWATMFHDMGKLQDDNQVILSGETGESLPYMHESAGALHCWEHGQTAAAFAIHSHQHTQPLYPDCFVAKAGGRH